MQTIDLEAKELARQRSWADLEQKRRGLRRHGGVLRPGVFIRQAAQYPLRLMHCNRRDNL